MAGRCWKSIDLSGIELEYPSLCNLLDLIYFREGDNVPLFFDYVGWLLGPSQG